MLYLLRYLRECNTSILFMIKWYWPLYANNDNISIWLFPLRDHVLMLKSYPYYRVKCATLQLVYNMRTSRTRMSIIECYQFVPPHYRANVQSDINHVVDNWNKSFIAQTPVKQPLYRYNDALVYVSFILCILHIGRVTMWLKVSGSVTVPTC